MKKYHSYRRFFVKAFALVLTTFLFSFSGHAQLTSASLSTQHTLFGTRKAVDWNRTGSKIYLAGGSRILEYSTSGYLSTNQEFGGVDESFDLDIKATLGIDLDNITGIAFSYIGDYLYVVGEGGVADDYINILHLSSPYDLSTASVSNITPRNIVGFSQPQDIQFNKDGSKAYVLAEDDRRIYVFELASPFRIDSNSPSPGGNSFLVPSELNPTAFAFNANGTRLYVVGHDDDRIREYYLPEPFEISNYTSVHSYSVGSDFPNPEAIGFDNDDNELYVVGYNGSNRKLIKYTLNAYPIATSSIPFGSNNPDKSSVRFRVLFSEGVTGFGRNSYTVKKTGDVAYENVTVSPGTTTTNYYIDITGVSGTGSLKVDVRSSTVTKVIDHSGLKMTGGFTDGTAYPIGSSFNPLARTTPSKYYDVNNNVAGATGNRDIHVNDDGTKMYVLDATLDKVLEFTLATPNDVSTATYNGDPEALDLTGIESNGTGLSFEANGTKLFIMGEQIDGLSEFNLSTAYDVSTAAFVRSTSVSPSSSNIDGFDFSSDGMKIFVASEGSIDKIVEYALPAPYDITSIIATGTELEVNNYEMGVRDLEIVKDGQLMIVVGVTGELIHTYRLSTPNDLSTAVYQQDLAVSTSNYEDNMYGISFSERGEWMYVIGTDEIINSYQLNRAPTVSSFTVSSDYNPTHFEATMDIEFSEPVTGLTVDDFELEYFGTTTGQISNLSGDNANYQITLNNLNGQTLPSPEGAIKVTIKDTGTDIVDVSGAAFAGKSSAIMVGNKYNIANAKEAGSFDLDDEDTEPWDLAFNGDGSKMFVLGRAGDDINEYDLGTPFDVTTAVYATGENLLLSDISSPEKLVFNNDGTKLFIRNSYDASIHEYTLATPYDVSIAQYSGIGESLDANASRSFTFNDDGTLLFSLGSTGIKKYALSTPFDVSTGTYVTGEDLTGTGSYAYDLAFDATGSRLFVASYLRPVEISVYWLGAPYDIASGVEGPPETFFIPNRGPYSIAFDNSGHRLFTIDNNDFVNQYELNPAPEVVSFQENHYPEGDFVYLLRLSENVSGVDRADFDYTISSGASIDNIALAPNPGRFTNVISYGASGDGVAQITLKDAGTGIVDLDGFALEGGAASPVIVLGSAFDVSGGEYLSLANSHTIAEETSPTSVIFNKNGMKMYVTGTASDNVHEYSLSSAYDLTTVSFVQTLDLGTLANPTAMTFNNDGSKLYVLSISSDDVSEYRLTTPYDISTSVYQGLDDRLYVGYEETGPTSIKFNHDGTKLFMIGSDSRDVNTYSLSTPYDVSKATYLGSSTDFRVQTEDTSPQSLFFSPDGKKLLVLGGIGIDINQYTLSEPFVPSSATYDGDENRLILSNDMTTPKSITFNDDGTKLFVISDETDNIIHAYDLNSAPEYTEIIAGESYNKISTEVDFTVSFDETVTGFTLDDIELVNTGTATGSLTALTPVSGSSTQYVATVSSIAGEGTIAVKGKVAGTDIIDLQTKPIVTELVGTPHDVDLIVPTATISIADAALKIGDEPTITIIFSEEVTEFTKADLVLSNGTVADLSTSDNITFTTTFTATADVEETTNVITVDMSELSDVAGNAGVTDVSTANFEIDTKRPTFLSFDVSDMEKDINGENSTTDFFVFTEVVTGFDAANLSATNGGFSNVGLDGSHDKRYIYTYTVASGLEVDVNVFQFDLSTVTDPAGNTGEGTFTSENYIIDTNPPTFTIKLSDENLTIGETATVTYTFSEPMYYDPSSLSDLEFEVSFTTPNGTTSNFVFVEGTTTISFTFTPNAETQDYTNEIFSSMINLVDGVQSDLMGVFNRPASPNLTKSTNYVVDNVRPTVTVDIDDNVILNNETATVTFTFSEAVSGFDNTDLTFSNGTLSNVASADGDITFTATFTPGIGLEEATNIISIDETGITDIAGNAGVGSSSTDNFEINTVVPTVVVTMDDNKLLVNETALVTFTFSEAVTGFENTDLTIPNGSLSPVSSADGGITFTATYTPTPSIEALTNVITVDNTGYADGSGNTGFATTDSENFIIDGIIPVGTIKTNAVVIISDGTANVKIVLNEEVLGLGLEDLTYSNGEITELIPDAEGLSYSATFIPSASTESETNAILLDNTGFTDLRGNVGTGSFSTVNFSIDTTLPTMSITTDDEALIAGETATITFAFSEEVTGFTNDDIAVTNGTLSAVSSSDGNVTFTSVFTPNVDLEVAQNTLSVNLGGVKDSKGNLGVGTESLEFLIDTKVQTILTADLSDLKLLEGETATVAIIFSEEVTGFELADIDAPNGMLSDLTSVDNITFSALYTPTEGVFDDTNVLTIDNTAFSDVQGNVMTGTTTTGNFEINTVIPTITFNELANKTYGESSFDLTATASSGLAVSYVSSDPSVASISGNTVTILRAGTTEINASQAGDADKNEAIDAVQSLTIEKAILTATADAKSKVYGEVNPALTVSYTGFVNGDDETAIITEATATTSVDETHGVGNYIIGVAGAEADNYSFNYIASVLSITAKELVATADDQTKAYGAANPTLTISYNGFENGDDETSIVKPIASTTASEVSGVGTYDISLEGGSAANYSITNVDGTLTVTQKGLTATADDQFKVYGEENPTFSITYSGFENGDDASALTTTATAESAATAASAVGVYDITVSGGAATNYSIEGVSGTLTVDKALLTATADDNTKVYGESNPALTVSYEGFVNADDESSISIDATASTLADATSAVGDYVIEASGAEAANYSFAYLPGNLSITAKELIATADDQAKVYGEENPTLTISYSGFENGDDETAIVKPTASTSASELSGVGTYDISLLDGSATNYSITNVGGTLTVMQKALTATADDQFRVYGEENPAFTISYAGFENGDNESILTTNAIAESTATATSAVGAYDITVSGGSATNYSIEGVSGTLTVDKAILTATADDNTKVYGASNPALTVSYEGFVNGEDASAISIDATASTLADATSAVGDYVIEVDGAEAANYSFVYLPGNLSITAKELIATADDLSKVYGAVNPTLTISYNGFENGDDETAIVKPMASTSASEVSEVGMYDISLVGGSATNYSITNVDGTLTVMQKALTATADDQFKVYGDENPAFTISYEGFENGEDASALSTLPSASTTADNQSNAGTYDITVSGGSANNYDLSYVSGTLLIEKADQTISFTEVANFDIINQTEVTLEATSSVGLDISYSLAVGSGSISGNILTVTESGSYQVEALQEGNENHNAASATVSFLVTDSNKADQTITFDEITNMVYGDHSFNVNAASSSDLEVTYTHTGPINMINNEVTILGAGSVTITAIQAGDDTFNPAESVTKSFEIAKALLTVAANNQTINYLDAIPELTFTYQGFVNGESELDLDFAPIASTNAMSSSDAGMYDIVVADGEDANYQFDYLPGTLSIDKLDQVISVNNIPDFDISTATQVEILASTTSGLALEYSLVQGDGTLNGTSLAVNTKGTYQVDVIQNGNVNYHSAPTASIIFNVFDASLSSQTITFEAISDKVYGDVFTLDATASSELQVSYSILSGPATVVGNAVSINGIGEVTILATQNGDATFNPASSTSQSFNVGRAALTASADMKTVTFGDAIPDLTITYAGFVNEDTEADLSEAPSISTSASAESDAGVYDIILTGGSSENYELSLQSGSLTIEKATADISITNLEQEATNSEVQPDIATDPEGLNYTVTYNGSTDIPSLAGSYEVIVTIDEVNYEGSATATFTLSEILGLEVQKEFTVSVYPNPAIDYFQVETDERLSLEIFNGSGVLLLKGETNTKVDISKLVDGLYFIRIMGNNNEQITTQRLLKQ